MSIPAGLRSQARSTYRLLFRTAANTFKGDDRVLNAFREKVRTDFREGRSIADPDAYTARIKLGQEVADVLKKNIVQGVKVDSTNASSSVGLQPETLGGTEVETEGGTWRLRLTKDTELGSNDSIRSSRPSLGRGIEGGQGCCQASTSSTSEPHAARFPGLLKLLDYADDVTEKQNEENEAGSLPSQAAPSVSKSDLKKSIPRKIRESLRDNDLFFSENDRARFISEKMKMDDDLGEAAKQKKRLNYSVLKRLSQERVKPELKEEDIEESFVRGSGPGGQSINKTANNVQLLHKPTGIRVTCQETRSLQTNRMLARRKLLEKLDQMENPGLSKEDMKRAKQVERERRRKKKAKARKKAKENQRAAEEHEDEHQRLEPLWLTEAQQVSKDVM